jgi:hypothetical protein
VFRITCVVLLAVFLLPACTPVSSQEIALAHGAPLGMPTRAVTATTTPTDTPHPTPSLTATPTASPTTTPTAMPPNPTRAARPILTATATPQLVPLRLARPTTLTATATLTTSTIPTPQSGIAVQHFLIAPEAPGVNGYPTLADFWDGLAEFVVDVEDTGLPMGESDTLVMHNGELWSYLHASASSVGTVDRCGNPVDFPGCTVIYRSTDGGRTFQHETPPICQFECAACPCVSENDHTEQQQYPRLAYNGATLFLVYEYLGRVRLRRSTDGLAWSAPERVADTGIWKLWLRTCRQEERIHKHPFVPYEYECLAGGPPGILAEEGRLYIFVGMGQNPGAMGCYVGSVTTTGEHLTRCQHNPLFVGAGEYGPLEEKGSQTNPYFDFRTISSAEVQRVGQRVYMLYEGTRGPGHGDAGDTQFGLGLARSLMDDVDGPWEKYPGNPILIDLPGNVGLGHADVVAIQGQTFLYTSLNGYTRSRLALVWK